jgi:hypothetical protein
MEIIMFYTCVMYGPFEPTRATTLAAAKRIAERRNSYKGADLSVAIAIDDNGITRFDPIAKKRNGVWQDML